ncbi:MAG: diaminopimelate decarboxylase [Chloroflexaceae bacterium]|jgi:diaminopimelate decarboxylase|nr:diaminopimelate decarboxylase [Chloroflexaceae bacterium]
MNITLWPDTATIHNGHLHLGGCDVTTLAAEHGTPLYLFDEATLRGTMRAYQAAFARFYEGETRIHYASKALLNTAIAQLVAQEGLGLDVVSGTELLVARRAGLPMAHVHMHGNAKTRTELERAVDWDIGAVVVDNLDELEQLAALTVGRAEPQGVLLRLAPNIQANTHAHIATGSADSKFGLPLAALDAAAERLLDAPGLRLLGLHAHIGSQLFEESSIRATVHVLLDMAARLRLRHGLAVEELSPGGGLGVPYTAEMPASNIEAYAEAVATSMYDGEHLTQGWPLPRLTVEPGRSIVARAGVAIYSVIATKRSVAKIGDGRLATHANSGNLQSAIYNLQYLHVDGGMADNLRPALYGARYTALLANKADAPATQTVHVAGRYCESGDVLLRDAPLPPAAPGDLLAVAVAGAYTLSMASNYNMVPRPAVLLLRDGQARLIQRRETEEDLLARDVELT